MVSHEGIAVLFEQGLKLRVLGEVDERLSAAEQLGFQRRVAAEVVENQVMLAIHDIPPVAVSERSFEKIPVAHVVAHVRLDMHLGKVNEGQIRPD